MLNDVSSNPGPMAGFPQSLGMEVAHLNIRSIVGKIDVVQLLLKEKPFDILRISESWLKPHIADHEMSLPGYSFVRNERKVTDLVAVRLLTLKMVFHTEQELTC